MGVEATPPATPPTALAGLSFLVGRWLGAGTWGAAPFTSRTDIRWLLGRHLQIDVEAQQDGRPPHAERFVVHAEPDGRVAALLFPDRGDVQRFDVVVGDGTVRFVYTPVSGSASAPQRWTIRRTDAGYDEIFEVAPGGGAFRPSVTCSYARVTEEST